MDYYRARMDAIYAALRGDDNYSNEGTTLDAKALTVKQASAVINLFSQFLDRHDLRLDVPEGRDYLASSYDGGYSWCDLCYKPKAPDDISSCRRRKCPLIAENE